jgi:tetratricopeptide (TPR) repeat protein
MLDQGLARDSAVITQEPDAGAPLESGRTGPSADPIHTIEQLIHKDQVKDDFRKIAEFYELLAKDHPQNEVYKHRLARSCFYRSMFAFIVNTPVAADEALASVRRGTAVYDDLLRSKLGHADYSLEEARFCAYAAGMLAISYAAYGEAVGWCDKALAVLDAAKLGEGQQAAARGIRLDALLVRAAALDELDRSLEALADFARAFALEPSAKEGAFGMQYAKAVANARKGLVSGLLRKGKYAAALAEAEALLRIPGIPGEALYEAACVFGVAAGISQDAGTREKYASRCVELLRLAHATGFGKDPIQKAHGVGDKPVRYMENDKDLIAVRAREDYRKLLAELKGQP